MTPTLMGGDAVGNDVLGMQDVLRERGLEVNLFAQSWTLKETPVRPYEELKQFLRDPSDILIYHYSMGWEPGLALLSQPSYRTVIKYHNVTPPEFFEGISQSHVEMCRDGRTRLKTLALADCDLYLSASDYNRRELISEGAPRSKCFVVAPFHHLERLDSVEPDTDVLDACLDGKTNILMVGRISPNKGHAALIEAFATYYYHYNSNSRLLLVGKEEFEQYSSALRKLVASLELEGAVVFTGEVTEAALKAYYMSAHVFMITSEHEGFCVPLVEAMAMKVPIVARSSSAIPATVGDSGLVWKENNPYLLAESVNFIVSDQSLSASLSERGYERYRQRFTNESIREDFLSALASLL
jgi:glycosyltransferase involved in cell wall biosynthesis